jgi:hypothetical protein
MRTIKYNTNTLFLSRLESDTIRVIEEFRGLKRERLAVEASTAIAAYLLKRWTLAIVPGHGRKKVSWPPT